MVACYCGYDLINAAHSVSMPRHRGTLEEGTSIPADIDSCEVRSAIRQELVRIGELRYHRRLHGVLLMASGLSSATVAAVLGDDPRTVQRWLKRYRSMGLDGLRDRVRPGRPPTLNAAQRASLARDLDRRPAELNLPGRTWSGTTLATHLRERYGSTLGIRQCQRLLNELRNHARTTANIKSPRSSAHQPERKVPTGGRQSP